MYQFIDGYVDRSRNRVLLSEGEGTPVCFDLRKLHHAGLPQDAFAYDVKMLFEHDGELTRLVKTSSIPSKQEYLDLEKRFTANVRAVGEARMDVEQNSLKDLTPDDLHDRYMSARIRAIRELFETLKPEKLEEYRELVWPVFGYVREVEKNGIKVDEAYVQKMLKRNDMPVHEEKFFRHIQGTCKDGFVRTRISPVGSRTWRLRVEGGFNCMAIPHGAPRKAIVSRFEGGKILTIDFNAIDYRCLVAAVDDPGLNKIYEGQRDFHVATAAIFGEVTPELRDQTKKITYAHIYGSSIEGLQKLTLLPQARLLAMLAKLDERFAPITEFRRKLAEKSRQDGYLITPGGHRVVVEKGDHDGKIVGLFAQTYSSWIFNRALGDALSLTRNNKSCVIFTVHDELVVDMHPSEADWMPQSLSHEVEGGHGSGFVVKYKTGESYGEATDG